MSKYLYILGYLPGICLAQVPDAGQMNRQQEAVQQRSPLSQEPASTHTQNTPDAQSGERIVIHQVIFDGSEGLASPAKLDALVADSLGKSLGFSEIQRLAYRVSQHLHDEGWLLAQAYLPKQEIKNNTLHIQIVLAKLEKNASGQLLIIESEDGVRLDESTLHQRIAHALEKDSLQSEALERALLLINDLPGMDVQVGLQKGSHPGTSRLTLKAKEESMMSGSFSVDNFGNRYVGDWRGNLILRLTDPLGWGDQLVAGGTGSEALGQGRASYSLPIGSHGLEANVNYNYLSYNIGREFKSLDIRGIAQVTGGGLRYPFIRSRELSLWGTADFSHKTLRSSNSTQTLYDRQINNGITGLALQTLDHFMGGGFTQFSYAATLGDVDLSGVRADQQSDGASAKSQGFYDKHNFNFSRLQKLTDQVGLFVNAYGQLAGKNLTSAEQFILGGPYGIRAYPIGEASGDSGWVVNLELRYDVPYDTSIGRFQLVGFFDTGHIVQNTQTWKNSITNISGQNQYSLSGGGAGITYSNGENFSFKGIWAHNIGNNPGLSKDYNNSDGMHHNHQFWMLSTLSF